MGVLRFVFFVVLVLVYLVNVGSFVVFIGLSYYIDVLFGWLVCCVCGLVYDCGFWLDLGLYCCFVLFDGWVWFVFGFDCELGLFGLGFCVFVGFDLCLGGCLIGLGWAVVFC